MPAITSIPGWLYTGAPTLVQLNREGGMAVCATAPEQLRAEDAYWKSFHEEKQERLERFQVAVKERVARAAHIKREVRVCVCTIATRVCCGGGSPALVLIRVFWFFWGHFLQAKAKETAMINAIEAAAIDDS